MFTPYACRWSLFLRTPLLLAAVAAPQIALSQALYQPGQAVEYKASASATAWQQGTVEYVTPGGKQIIIRSKPSELYPKGDTRAYNLEEVRPVTSSANTATPRTASNAPTQGAAQTPTAAAGQAASPSAAGPVLSAQDVAALLQATIGDPRRFADYRQKEAAMNEAARVIRERGVNFRFDQAPQIVLDALNKHEAQSQITGAIRQNLGPPASKAYYLGAWDMSQIGGETRVKQYRAGYDLVTREGGAKAGALVIKADGTYLWNHGSGIDKGNWRLATAAELAQSDKGGAGIVLLNAKLGQRSKDWIVFKHSMTNADNIAVADIEYRTRREYGGRQ
jgi:hypothetical protein